jgi:hypothetical protein
MSAIENLSRAERILGSIYQSRISVREHHIAAEVMRGPVWSLNL